MLILFYFILGFCAFRRAASQSSSLPSSTPTIVDTNRIPTSTPTSAQTLRDQPSNIPTISNPTSIPTNIQLTFPSSHPTKVPTTNNNCPTSTPTNKVNVPTYSPTTLNPTLLPTESTAALSSKSKDKARLTGSDIAGILAVVVFAVVLALCVCFKHKSEERLDDPEDSDQQPLSLNMKAMQREKYY